MRKLIVCNNTSNRAGYRAIMFTSLSLCDILFIEAVCPPVTTVYSKIILSESITTLMRVS